MTHYHIAVDGTPRLTTSHRKDADRLALRLLLDVPNGNAERVAVTPCTEYHKVPLQTHYQRGTKWTLSNAH